MMISAADNVQYVAVTGLSLKLPNVCLYFCAMEIIDRTDAEQAVNAFWDVGFSGEFSCCSGEDLAFSSVFGGELPLRKGPHSRMNAV
jgi:hypothetical protein